MFYDVNAINTICNATFERQSEAKELAKRSDAMIVIGGSSSSNTKKVIRDLQKPVSGNPVDTDGSRS